MRTVGLISDTHIPTRAKSLPDKVWKLFENVSLILHAGDLTQMKIVQDLECLAPVVAVCGNMDELEVMKKLPKTNFVEIENWKIRIIHRIQSPPTNEEVLEDRYFGILVFGHTHQPFVKWINNVLWINPGSPTNPMPPFVTKPSVGLLKISEHKVEPEIVRL